MSFMNVKQYIEIYFLRMGLSGNIVLYMAILKSYTKITIKFFGYVPWVP